MHAKTLLLSYLASFFSSVFLRASCAAIADQHHLLLNCGSDNGGTDEDGRKWMSDTRYLTGNNPHARAQYQDSSISSEIPFMDARIFTSRAMYELPIRSKTRYWLRLYFYPADYLGLNISNSYFFVQTAGVTLLKNFSASLTAQALTQAYFIKEYSLAPMEHDVLNVTFEPEDQPSDAFAFVNGIELIPVLEIFGEGSVVGFVDQTMDAKSAHLETMYRLNVAGQYIPPTGDAGGSARTWYDDAPYLLGASTGVHLQSGESLRIQYGELPERIAPPDVYKTARGMGFSKNVNKEYNLTWLFRADANFSYLLRFHFCEFQLTKVNQKVFNIYINNRTAQADPNPADIIGWTGGIGAPTYKDYVVLASEDVKEEDQIRVDLHPSTSSKPEFYDASLNGLEIFKMADGNENLAGHNPDPSVMLLPEVAHATQNGFREDKKAVIGRAAGGAAGLCVVAALIGMAAYNRKKRVPGTAANSHVPISAHSSHLSIIAQGLCRHFTMMEMKQATTNFDESNVIGVGGFGKVYSGIIDQRTRVAIKRSNPTSEQGVHEFRTEVEMLSKLRHKHLVSLIGFCEEDGEMCLVYDYMALGTVREHLYNGKKPPLSWNQRLEICIGAARGLHYLHTGAKYTIIHRDVKTTNILLDENQVAKVSDFGLSKTGPNVASGGHVSTVVKGSFGYLDPEYFRRQQLTEKSDVYSFGVVLFEVLCARPALNPSLPKHQVSLAEWALHSQKKGFLNDIVDPHIKEKIKPDCLKKFVDTAEKCLSETGSERPTMGDVLWNLEFALQLQNPDGSNRGAQLKVCDGDEMDESLISHDLAMHYKNLGLEINYETSVASDNSGYIFSQIAKPKGR